jgi:allantoinase
MKVNPPIRAKAIEGLWKAFEAGKVEFVSSDHSSWPVNNKQTPAIFDAGAGIPGLETLAPSFFTDLKMHVAEPAMVLAEYLSTRPAQFFGLDDRKGSLAVGLDADVAILGEGSFAFDASQTRDGLNWSPYDGETFAARIQATYLRGSKLWNGKDVSSTARGRYVPRLNYVDQGGQAH